MRKNNEAYCNKCGKKITDDFNEAREEMLHVEKNWGYFSEKDGEKHAFDLCESCYDEWIKSFSLPIEVIEEGLLI